MGQPYFATCIESADGKYVNIQNVVKLPKSMVCPEPINATQIILKEDWPNAWDTLPEYIKTRIMDSDEYNGEYVDILG
jgi:hypothetical protein